MANKSQALVSIVMGSDSDQDIMARAARTLDEFEVPYEVKVISAHRTPDRCRTFSRGAAARGIKVIIAGAGKAAHLAGVIASQTTLPVFGVPIDAGLGGLDALLATVQMPGGIPVASLAVGGSGATNAALMAVAILALHDKRLARKLADFRKRQAETVAAKSNKVARRFKAGK